MQKAAQQLDDGAGQPDGPRRPGRSEVESAAHHLHRPVFVEVKLRIAAVRQPAGEQDVQRHAERPHVGAARVERTVLQNFRRPVAGRTLQATQRSK